jgi:hypothetical protein
MFVTVANAVGADEYPVQAWLARRDGRCPRITGNEFSRPRSRLSEILAELLPTVYGQLGHNVMDLTIELFLPQSLLLCGPHAWEFRVGPNRFRTVGSRYWMVVRSWDRLYDPRMEVTWPAWQAQWGRIPKGAPLGARPLWWAEDSANHEMLYNDLWEREKPVALSLCLLERPPEALSSLLDAGVPVGVWVDTSCPNPQAARRKLVEVVKAAWLTDLPERVRELRAESSPLGSELTLLLDDPERLPPDRIHSAAMPE